MKKKNEILYKEWSEHLNQTKERTNYSVRRFDLLIISISGAGLYIIFETLRELKTGNIESNNSWLLIISGILFLFSIISNFISQKTGEKSNTYEEKYIYMELDSIKGLKIDRLEQERLDTEVQFYNKCTEILNNTSMIFMLVGLVMLGIFNYLLFL